MKQPPKRRNEAPKTAKERWAQRRQDQDWIEAVKRAVCSEGGADK